MSTEIEMNKEEFEAVVTSLETAKNNMSLSKNVYNSFRTRNMTAYQNYVAGNERLCNIVTRYKQHVTQEIIIFRGIEASIETADQRASSSIQGTNS